MSALYNEIDPYAADWLENLIGAGHIAPGVVDRRSIVDVRPADLAGAAQVYLFAGIGVWSGALRDVGWPDDRAIWSASCPCQPFSGAGKGNGFADERHLWPFAYHLIGECRPPIVVGEQVASKDGLRWLDLVQADMEAAGYAFGAVDTCAAGFGVEWEESPAGEWLQRAIRDCGDPWVAGQLRDFAAWAGGNIVEGAAHIRQRLYWGAVRLADAADPRSQGRSERGDGTDQRPVGADGMVGRMADADGGHPSAERLQRGGQHGLGPQDGGAGERVADAAEPGRHEQPVGDDRTDGRPATEPRRLCVAGVEPGRPGPSHSLRRDADWLFCRDGKWRPVESGTFPLAHAQSARVGRLRAYGNAIDRAQAAGFLRAFLGVI